MSASDHSQIEAKPEQVLYAKVLEIGMYVGLALLFVTFALYVLGIVKPYIPLDEVSRYWGMNVEEYLHQADVHAGWAWLKMVGYSDFLNFIPVAILAGVTVVCFLAIVPGLLKSGDTVYAVLCLLEALILAVAASGILGAGGH